MSTLAPAPRPFHSHSHSAPGSVLQFAFDEYTYHVWRQLSGSMRAYAGAVRAPTAEAAAIAALATLAGPHRLEIKARRHGRTLLYC